MKKLVIILLTFLVLASGVAFARGKEIAVAASDKTPGASISGQAALAPFFLFYDGKGKFIEAKENPYKSKGGAAEEVAEFLSGRGVRIVVAGGFGGALLVSELPPAGVAAVLPDHSGGAIVESMKEKGIEAVLFDGSARDAVKAIKKLWKSSHDLEIN